MRPISGHVYTFNSIEQLYETAETLPEAERYPVYGYKEGADDWQEIHWRNSLWLDDGRLVGDVSSSDTYYNVIQYGDILDAVGRAVEQYDGTLEVDGHAALSPSGHTMSSQVNFRGDTDVLVDEGDAITLGLKIRSGHSGYHGLKYDVGAERQVCSNGMMAFVSDLHFEQSHHDPLQYGLAQHAVDTVVEGADVVEHRLQDAQEQTFWNRDEALLVLLDLGLDQYVDDAYDTLRDCLDAESDADQPSLYETYNAATRALTHHVDDDVPAYVRDEGLERAARLLDTGTGLPDADAIGRRTVDSRVNQFIDDEDTEEYWPGEHDTVTELLQSRTGGGE